MRIDEIGISGFGKWENAEFRFGTGINLIIADNEAGKSTLQEAIFALLYGMKRDYLKKAIKKEEWQRYFPWSAKNYGGRIVYRVGDKTYVIERDLNTDAHRLLHSQLLREISKSYAMDARKERNFVMEQIGLTRSLFEEITRIGNIGIDHHQHMAEWLHQQMGSEAEVAASYQEVFSILEQKRREIGKGDTGKETRLAQANHKLKVAKEEYEQAKQGMQKLRQLENRYRELVIPNPIFDVDIQQLQVDLQQALLSKQQHERFLLDYERLQNEEEAAFQKINDDQMHNMDTRTFRQQLEQQQEVRKELDKGIRQCEDKITDIDEEILTYEQMLPQLLESQRKKELKGRWKKGASRARVAALLIALLGIGSYFVMPWYYGAGMWVLALLLLSTTLRPTPKRKLDRNSVKEGLDYWSAQEQLQQLRQNREVLIRSRLQLEQNRIAYREKEVQYEQLMQITCRKRDLLLHMHISREVDRPFVERWQVESQSESYTEELMIEDLINRLKQIQEEITEFTSSIDQQIRGSKEQEQVARELAHIEGEMKTYQSLPLAELETRYDQARMEKEEWERKRRIIDLAKQLFQETLEEWNRYVSPALSHKASEVFAALTNGRYDQVRADPTQGFRLRVIESNNYAVHEEGQLSSGTEQQLYLALRLALIDQYSEQHRLPVFLDDSFTHYDPKRLEKALLYLEEMSARHQIFLFSCQAREQEMLDNLGIEYHKVQLG